MATHTRTHVHVEFANPYLTCDTCGERATGFHDSERCGCDEGSWNEPCGHRVSITSVCPSWNPVDGCTCQADLGLVSHEPARAA